MKKILLDTNAYAACLAGNKGVYEVLAKAEIVYFSVVVIAELLSGFKGGNRFSQNSEILSRFLDRPTVSILEVSLETAEIFAEVKNQLKVAGTPIPINDVWIAAQAVETGSLLITFDAHFEKVKGVRVWDF